MIAERAPESAAKAASAPVTAATAKRNEADGDKMFESSGWTDWYYS